MGVVDLILNWAVAHPLWAGMIVFIIAFAESLAIVGLFLPGAAMMFGVGAVIGSGGLDLLPTLIWAALGAIAGDGVSYWLGRHYNQQLLLIWPFRSHPELVAKSTLFFYRHGGKSVLLGRFIGPIRPVIPAVAGMLAMPPGRFFIVNAISGIFWAPVYVLPGMVFASTLGIAAEVATRLAVLLGFFLAGLFILFWLLRHGFSWLHSQTYPSLRKLLTWSRLHPVAGNMPAALLDPAHPEAKGLSTLALLLLLVAIGSAWLFSVQGEAGLLTNLDHYIYNQLQSLRTPAIDTLIGILARLGNNGVLLALFSVIFFWLGWRGRWMAAMHWLAAGAFSSMMILAIGLLMDFPTPPGAQDMTNNHAVHSMVVYGFLGVLIGRECNATLRVLAYTLAGMLIGLVALTHVYLGIHWLTSTLAGLSFGLAWVLFLGIAYRHHASQTLPPTGLIGAALLTLIIVLPLTAGHPPKALIPVTIAGKSQIGIDAWLDGAWQALPGVRIDMRNHNEQPLSVQFAGPLNDIEQALIAQGWLRPPVLDTGSWLKWLNKDAQREEMPILPHVHDGKNESLLLVRTFNTHQVAFRLWPTGLSIESGQQPLWVGSLGYLYLPKGKRLLRVPRTRADYTGAVEDFLQQLPELSLFFRVRFREDATLPTILLATPLLMEVSAASR